MPSEKVNQSLAKALSELRQERARIDDAITKLQAFLGSLGAAPRRGPGRPPKASYVATVTAKARGWSGASRKAAAARMRRYWADRKKSGGKPVKAAKPTKVAKSAKAPRSKAWDPAKRKAAAERMRKYWADRRKTAAT